MFNRNEWSRLRDADLEWCVRRLPHIVRSAMKKDGSIAVAGGFIRSCITREAISDVDLFTTSKDDAEALAYGLAGCESIPEYGTDARKLCWESDNAFTVKSNATGFPVQVIHRWSFDRPELVVPSFDFTIARAAIWFDKDAGGWDSLCDPNFYSDLAARRLVYCAPDRNEDAGGSMLRVLKFYQKGYRIPLDSLGAVIARLVGGIKHDSRAADETDEQWRARILTGLLREVDPNTPISIAAYDPAMNSIPEGGDFPPDPFNA